MYDCRVDMLFYPHTQRTRIGPLLWAKPSVWVGDGSAADQAADDKVTVGDYLWLSGGGMVDCDVWEFSSWRGAEACWNEGVVGEGGEAEKGFEFLAVAGEGWGVWGRGEAVEADVDAAISSRGRHGVW